MWIGDTNRHVIEKLNDDGAIEPVAGQDRHPGHVDGSSLIATFGIINAIAADPSGGLLVADGELVRRVSPQGEVSTIAGSQPAEEDQDASRRRARDGRGRAAVFGGIGGLAASATGDIYVTDTVGSYSAIRRIDKSGMVTTLMDAAHSQGRFRSLGRISVDTDGSLLVVDNDDRGELNRPRLLKVDLFGRIGTRFDPVAPEGRYDPKHSGIWGFVDMALDSRSGRVYATDYLATTIHRIDPNGEAYAPCFVAIAAQAR
jgi:DNA-binding beta-propeller fold protein YncE